ncbi:MAG: hypothetical protein ABWY55_11995 [Microbacterium sp.]
MTDVTRTAGLEPGPDGEPLVLELRVHGVNNTTPASLLDLPPEWLRFAADSRGDRRATFWVADPETNPDDGERGHVPPGIRRVAYSWGGLVRTSSKEGGGGLLSTLGAAAALAFQVFALPFSLGNAAMWTRRLTIDSESGGVRIRAAVTAGAARLFGLMLTLLFTSTALTITVDIAALQCAAGADCVFLWDSLSSWIEARVDAAVLTPGRVLAAWTLVAVAAVGLLVWFAGIARRRYDTLHVRRDAVGDRVRDAIEVAEQSGTSAAADARPAVLAQRAFWSNRITGRLALVHFAAAIALIVTQVSLHVALGGAQSDTAWLVFWVAATTLGLSVVGACVLPTMTITPPGAGGGKWSAWVAWPLLVVSIVSLLALLTLLSLPGSGGAADVGRTTDGLIGQDLPPLIIVTVAAATALSGVFWRPMARRDGTAWAGCGPAVFMSLSLALAMLTSAAVLVVATILVALWSGPAQLAAGVDSPDGLHVPDVYLTVGGLIGVGIVVSVIVLASFLLPRKSLDDRAGAWTSDSPTEPLFARVQRLRKRAAIIHLVEPAAGALATIAAAAVVGGLIWAWLAYATSRTVTTVGPATADWVTGFLVVMTWALLGFGILLAVVVALGVLLRNPGLIAIVWDITCYLPRTAQPFGPPCYAERAVPDIAQQLDDWLADHPERRAILSAHSMGAVISVSALALLAATTKDKTVMSRIALLTFGVQLRTFFGRFLPELVGPAVLGTYPTQAPRIWRRDPWAKDAAKDTREWPDGDTAPASFARLDGTLLPTGGVRWISLWRLTDYLGFTAAVGQGKLTRGDREYTNDVDRYVEEIDRTVEPPIVVTHNDYIRVPSYQTALLELVDGLPRA